MQLKQPLTKLPLRFSADSLAAEIRSLPSEAWVPHPRGFAGNEAVPLVTPHGEATDAFLGPMGPTEHLLCCPFIMEVMAELDSVWGRSRLMGLAPGSDVPPHVDIKYYWRTHTRIHVPIITNPGVEFTCGDETVHMAAGECWVVDTFRLHTVHNHGSEQRIHLVLDTVGSTRLWDLIEQAEQLGNGDVNAEILSPTGRPTSRLQFEQHQAPRIMSPWELRGHIHLVIGMAEPHPLLDTVRARLDRLVAGWFGAWAQFGTDDAGLPDYRALLESVRKDLQRLGPLQIQLRNGLALYRVLEVLLFANAVPPDQIRQAIDGFALEKRRGVV